MAKFIELHDDQGIRIALSTHNLDVEDIKCDNEYIRVNGNFVKESYDEVIKLWRRTQ